MKRRDRHLLRTVVLLLVMAGSSHAPGATELSEELVPPEVPGLHESGHDLDERAARMRRLQLAALGLDATQSVAQVRLANLRGEHGAADHRLARMTDRVRDARTETARSLGIYMAADLGGADAKRLAIRRALLTSRHVEQARIEGSLRDARDDVTQVQGKLAEVERLLVVLDQQATSVASARDEVDDAPIAAFAIARAREQVASRLEAPVQNAHPYLMAEADKDIVWPAAIQSEGDVDHAPGLVPPTEQVLRSWSSLLASPGPSTGALPEAHGQGRGITIDVGPGELLAAPAGGTIVFAGEFRTYGLILIIDHGDGYHTLMAGFSHLDVELGAIVRPGEVVGSLGSMSGSAGRLYVEVRHQGVPVDPMPWFAAREDKVRG